MFSLLFDHLLKTYALVTGGGEMNKIYFLTQRLTMSGEIYLLPNNYNNKKALHAFMYKML